MQYYFYLARCADGSLYVGYTRNLKAREQVHNLGEGARYTALRRPVKIVYSEEFGCEKGALFREAQVKRWSRIKKEKLIRGELGFR